MDVGDVAQPWGPECGAWRVRHVDREKGLTLWEPLSPADLKKAQEQYRREMRKGEV